MRAIITIYAIWLREFKQFYRERSRIVSMLAQPLLYLLVVGEGISATMAVRGAPPGINYLQFMYPGILGMSVLFTSIFSAVSIIWDRDFGFLKEVLVAPVPRWAVAVGKALGGSTVAVLQAAILLLLSPWVHVPLGVGRAAELLLLLLAISFGLTSLGIAIAARMESMQGFQMIMNFLVMPLYFLSGALFPLRNVPAWMLAASRFDPLSYGVDALRNILYSGPLHRLMLAAGLIRFHLGEDLLWILGLALLLTAFGTWSFSRQD